MSKAPAKATYTTTRTTKVMTTTVKEVNVKGHAQKRTAATGPSANTARAAITAAPNPKSAPYKAKSKAVAPIRRPNNTRASPKSAGEPPKNAQTSNENNIINKIRNLFS